MSVHNQLTVTDAPCNVAI